MVELNRRTRAGMADQFARAQRVALDRKVTNTFVLAEPQKTPGKVKGIPW